MDQIDRSKVFKIVKKGSDESNMHYWYSIDGIERLRQLEELRKQYIIWKYGNEQRFQRVYRVVKRV